MMRQFFVVFQKPRTMIGHIIKWRLGDTWSHTAVIVDGRQYNAKLLTGITCDPEDPRPVDTVLHFELTDDQFNPAFTYLISEVGTVYDWKSLAGWIFGIKELHELNHVYCHEYTRNFFVAAGLLLPDTADMINARTVIREISPFAIPG